MTRDSMIGCIKIAMASQINAMKDIIEPYIKGGSVHKVNIAEACHSDGENVSYIGGALFEVEAILPSGKTVKGASYIDEDFMDDMEYMNYAFQCAVYVVNKKIELELRK